MEMLVRWKCSCSNALDADCSECEGAGYIESWVPVELLRVLDGRESEGIEILSSRPTPAGRNGFGIPAVNRRWPAARLTWMEAFPSS